jgi:hypothetical protein
MRSKIARPVIPIGNLPSNEAANTCRISRGSSSATYRAREIMVLQNGGAAIVARGGGMLRRSIQRLARLFHVKPILLSASASSTWNHRVKFAASHAVPY